MMPTASGGGGGGGSPKEIRLKVSLDGSDGTAAMADIADEAERAGKSITKAQEELARMRQRAAGEGGLPQRAAEQTRVDLQRARAELPGAGRAPVGLPDYDAPLSFREKLGNRWEGVRDRVRGAWSDIGGRLGLAEPSGIERRAAARLAGGLDQEPDEIDPVMDRLKEARDRGKGGGGRGKGGDEFDGIVFREGDGHGRGKDKGGVSEGVLAEQEKQAKRVAKELETLAEGLERAYKKIAADSRVDLNKLGGGPQKSGVDAKSPAAAAASPGGGAISQVINTGLSIEALKQIGDFGLALLALGENAKSAREEVDGVAEKIPFIGGTVASLARLSDGLEDRLEEEFGSLERKFARKFAVGQGPKGLLDGWNLLNTAEPAGMGGDKELRKKFNERRNNFDAEMTDANIIAKAGPRIMALKSDQADREFRLKRDDIARDENVGIAVGGALFGGLGPEAAIKPQILEAQRETRIKEAEFGAARIASMRTNNDRRRIEGIADRDKLAAGEITESVSDEMKLAQRENRKPLFLENQLLDMKRKIADSTSSIATHEESINRSREKGITAANAELATMKSRTGEMKAQLAILREEESKAKSDAVDFASKTPREQQLVKEAYARAEKDGYDKLSKEERETLAGTGLTSDYYKRLAEKSASDSPLYQGLRTSLGLRDAKDLTEQRIKVEQEVRVKVEFDEKKFAETMRRVMDEWLKGVNDSIIRNAEVERQKAVLRDAQKFGGG